MAGGIPIKAVGARLAEVHTIRPEVAKVHVDRFQESVRYAIHARVREAAGFQITELGQCLFDNFGLSKKTSAKTKTMAAKLGWTTGYNAIDNKATKDALKLTGQAKEDTIKYINGFAESFAAGTTSSKNGGQNRDHMNVISTQKSVRAALRKKLSGTPTNACGFP
ncbi:hypothetical protein SBRCBS47491_006570 [Sporothrix bragantina]|uniref:Uncharacterized protein n=1 Tax=Sporothrix bragantina TaxID=671064 RepID=A0ABP0C6B2_9PEZI